MTVRHFPYQHPTFGSARNPKTSSYWKRSVYYWWYEYLRRNLNYRNTCARGGKGKLAKLYKDFGDITTLDFKMWWSMNDRGATLFAEPVRPSIQLVSDSTVNSKADQADSLVLRVPLNLPINFLVKSFREIVAKHHKGRRGIRSAIGTNALYKATGKIDVQFLEIALMVWDAREAEPKKPLWQIAQDLRIGGPNRILASDPPSVVTDKKNTLAALTSRYYRKANQMIANTALGRFPYLNQ